MSIQRSTWTFLLSLLIGLHGQKKSGLQVLIHKFGTLDRAKFEILSLFYYPTYSRMSRVCPIHLLPFNFC